MKKTEKHWVSVMYPEIFMGFCFKVLKGSIRIDYSNNKNTYRYSPQNLHTSPLT